MAHGSEHSADLPLTALAQLDLQAAAAPGGAGQQPDTGGPGRPAVDLDPVLELLELRSGGRRVQFDDVGLGHAVPRVSEGMGEGPVVGEQQQTLAVAVQTPDRVQPLDGRMAAAEFCLEARQDEFHYSVRRVRVRACRVEAGRLVQRHVQGRWTRGDQAAVHLDGRVLRVNFRPKLRNQPAVDADPAGRDQRFGVAPGRDAGGGEDLL